jgi:hypothetical protein
MIFNCSVVLAKDDTEVHFHALQSMTEQFQLHEWEHCCVGTLQHCSEITFGSWDVPNYLT